jgi:Fe-S-cluster containining protein
MLISAKTPKEAVLKLGETKCKGCVHCCRYGSGALVESEAKKIAKFLRLTEEELKQKFLEEFEKFNTKRFRPKLLREKGKPYGKCIFLNEAVGCTIQEVKPLNCRIGSCNQHSSDLQKWFDFRYFLNTNNPESVRQYALWLEFNEPLPGAKLEELVAKDKLKKMLNYITMW